MKKKITARLEEYVVTFARRRAAEEGRSLSDLIQDALWRYLHRKAATPKERELAYRVFCQRPMKIPAVQLRHVLEDDMWIS